MPVPTSSKYENAGRIAPSGRLFFGSIQRNMLVWNADKCICVCGVNCEYEAVGAHKFALTLLIEIVDVPVLDLDRDRAVVHVEPCGRFERQIVRDVTRLFHAVSADDVRDLFIAEAERLLGPVPVLIEGALRFFAV